MTWAHPFCRRNFLGLCLLLGLWTTGFQGAAATSESGTANKASEKRRVVVLGDSITAGYGLDISEAYPALLQGKIDAAKLPFVVVNAGVSGDTTSGGLRRIDWVLKQPIDTLIIALGGNDGLRGIQVGVTQSNLIAIATKTLQKYPGAQVVIAGMQMPPNMGAEYTGNFKRLFEEVAKETHAALVPFLLEGVGGKAELNQPDLIHPTAEGQKKVADNVWAVLEPILKRRTERQ